MRTSNLHPILAEQLQLRRSRHRNHRIARNGPNKYTLFWTTDRRPGRAGNKPPSIQERTTDYAGAVRFAKEWNLPIPTPY